MEKKYLFKTSLFYDVEFQMIEIEADLLFLIIERKFILDEIKNGEVGNILNIWWQHKFETSSVSLQWVTIPLKNIKLLITKVTRTELNGNRIPMSTLAPIKGECKIQ